MSGMFHFDAAYSPGYEDLSVYPGFFDVHAPQIPKLFYQSYDFNSPWMSAPLTLPFSPDSTCAVQQFATDASVHNMSFVETTPSISSQFSIRKPSTTPSCDSSLTRTTGSCSPAPSQSLRAARSRSHTPVTATLHPRRKKTQAKAHKKVATGFRDRNRSWPRHILVRAKPLPNEPVTEFRYHMIILRTADVQSCGTAICRQLGIESDGHKSMRWIDKASGLQGAVDIDFLRDFNDMQDFVVDIVGVGNNGYVELLLEM